MKWILDFGLVVGGLLTTMALVWLWIGGAERRLAQLEGRESDAPAVAMAMAQDESYCSPGLKRVLRRVMKSCGLLGEGAGDVRGCQPLQAKNVATLSGNDFNDLFVPMAHRAAILQFEAGSAEIDLRDRALLTQTFADQGGASTFFVVARSSPDGSQEKNRKLSKDRGHAVLDVLRQSFDEPDLEKEVGLLWLGEEFAQLDEEFCTWKRSGPEEDCDPTKLNRSAFVTWVECRL